MTKGPLVTDLQVEGFVFPPTVKPPGSSKTLILAGAGERGLEIEGKFIKFTTVGVYFEEEAIPFLAVKWKGKSADELMDSVEFFMDIVKGPFEKFTRVTLILPLTGPQFSEKVAENCVRHLKAIGIHTEAVGVAVEKFKEVFSDQIFPPGSSILFTQFPTGSLTIGFSKDKSLPEEGCAVIENRPLSTAVLATSIGENGVCPAAKRSIAERLWVLLNQVEVKNVEENGVAKEQ